MFGKKAQPPIKSLIASGTRIEGNMKFNEGLRVDGEVFGDIQASPEEGSLLVIQPVKNAPEFRGKLELSVSGTLDGKPWMMPLPDGPQMLHFRQYRRVEGMLDLPADVVVKNVSARIIEGSVSRAVQSVSL